MLVLCDDVVTGFVERPVRDGVANPGALVLCLTVEDSNVERFLASVNIFTACLTQTIGRDSGDCQLQ